MELVVTHQTHQTPSLNARVCEVQQAKLAGFLLPQYIQMHRQVVLQHITTLLSLRHHCKAALVAAQLLGLLSLRHHCKAALVAAQLLG